MLLAWLTWEGLNFDDIGPGTDHVFSVVVGRSSLGRFFPH